MRTIDIPNELLRGENHKVWNPGIAEIDGNVCMVYRYEPVPDRWPSNLAMVNLDRKTLEVIPGTNKELKVIRSSARVQTIDDARLIVLKKQLYMVHAQGLLMEGGRWSSAVGLAQLRLTGECTKLNVIPYGNNINLASNGKEIATEKNWSPFVYNDHLRFIYLINPLTIIAWDGRKHREVTKQDPVEVPWWKWGNFFAGGTPLIQRGNEYIGICHTFTHDDPERPGYRRYYSVPYAISADSPHRLTRFGIEPLIYSEHDNDRDLRPNVNNSWRPNVVYPCGLLERGELLYISSGWQDCRCQLTEVPWSTIESMLRPVGPVTMVPIQIPEPHPLVMEEKPVVQEPAPSPLDTSLRAQMHRILTPMLGWCTTDKAMAIANQVERVKPRVCVEIGVFGGRSLVAMALAARHFGLDANCIGIDPWDKEAALEAMQDQEHCKWWSELDYEAVYQGCLLVIRQQNLQNSCAVWRARSEKVVDIFGDQKIDLLHIDGNHSAEVCMRDAALYMKKVREGGTIIVDDINWESTQSMQEFLNVHCTLVESRKMENGGEFAVFEKNKPLEPVQEAGFGGFFRKRGRPKKVEA